MPEDESPLTPATMRRFLGVFLCAGLLFAVLVAAIYRQDLGHQRVMLEQEAQHAVELQQELLVSEFRAVRSDLLYLASQATLTRFLSGDNSAQRELELEYVSFARNKTVYDQIRCLDITGQETVRINYREGDVQVVPSDELQTKATRYYYQQALSLNDGGVFVSPLDLNVEHGKIQLPIKPVIRFLTPVFDASGQKRGLLVINYLGAHLLSQLKQISAGFRGETMLINPAGEYLQAPDSNRDWGWLLDHDHRFRSDYRLAWEQGKRPVAGQFWVGGELFTFQPVSPGHRSRARQAGATTVANLQDDPSLVLVAYVSRSVATAHSRELLARLMLMYLGVMAVVALLSLYWARAKEIHKYHEQRIVESEARLRQLSSQLLAAQETERRNLSRDLHDELGQQVTAISLDLRSSEKAKEGSRSRELLRRGIEGTDQLLRSLHEIAKRVRPRVLDDLGLHDAVESLLAEYQERTGVNVTSELRFHRESIPPKVGENAYRILQEALANVATHAQTDRADVVMETDDDWLRITVRDPGIGFKPADPTESTRLGILGMSERVELLHGKFVLDSTPGVGTVIRVAIPLREAAP